MIFYTFQQKLDIKLFNDEVGSNLIKFDPKGI